MPDAATMIRIYAKATAAVRAAPGRRGRVVTLPDASDVLVAGDLHGQVGHFRRVYQIAALSDHPRRHLVLQEVIHGGHEYDDGSDKSHQLLDLVAAALAQFPGRVHFLPGNHEFAQLTGRPIAKSRGDLNQLFRAGVESAYGDRAGDVYAAMLELIRSSPLAVRTANRVFVSHSLPQSHVDWDASCLHAEEIADEALTPSGAVYRLVWNRDCSKAAADRFLQLVDADLLITGHIPCEQGYAIPNDRQVVLDAQSAPGGYCLFPADRPLTHAELVACIGTV
jgi:hypothetical protein